MKPIAIVLNGASSSGKTSIAHALQEMWPTPLIHASLDSFIDVFNWPSIEAERARKECHEFGIRTFHDYLTSIADCTYPIIVDHVFEQSSWHDATRAALHCRRVLLVGIHCSLAVSEKRERDRGNRKIGLSRWQHKRVHDNLIYDFEFDTSDSSPEKGATQIHDWINPS